MRAVRLGRTGVALVALLLAGCGHASSAPRTSEPGSASSTSTSTSTSTVAPTRTVAPAATPKGCLPTVKVAFRRVVRGDVKLAGQSRVPEILTCRYRAVSPHPGRCRTVTATVNAEAQPYTDFSRWEVEASQEVTQGGRHGYSLRPQPISGIGIGADWVPALHELEAANNQRWVTLILGCPAHVHVLALAKRLVRVTMRAPLG